MKIVNQKVLDIIPCPDSYKDTIKHIEKLGRLCYQSQDKITDDSAEKFVKMLFDRGHWAMLEHSWLVIKSDQVPTGEQWLQLYEAVDHSFLKVYVDEELELKPIICGNWRAWYEALYGNFMDYKMFKELPKAAPAIMNILTDINFVQLKTEEIDLNNRAYSVILKTDRSVTHELVRHRPASYAQESQRYCAYRDELEFIVPYFLDSYEDKMGAFYVWETLMNKIEGDYQFLLHMGCKPQEARAVLPNCTATQIAVTADTDEWEHIFKLRCAKDAYPGIRRLMTEVKDTFYRQGYFPIETYDAL